MTLPAGRTTFCAFMGALSMLSVGDPSPVHAAKKRDDPARTERLARVYVFYSEADAENRPTRNRLVRFTERDGRAAEATAILGDLPINQTRYYNGDHNGGRLAFGPDGMLYVSLGEMVRRSQVPDPQTPFGKILRVRPDGTVPPDNPYDGSPTYALGFRNDPARGL